MTITLRPEHEKAIAQAIQSGAYKSPDEVIERALEALRSEDAWLLDQKDEIAEKIDWAFGQFERGEFLSAEEARVEMEKRKATHLTLTASFGRPARASGSVAQKIAER